MAKIIVSGSIAYDRIMDYPGEFADHVIPEKKHNINLSFMVDKLSVQFGGTAGNIAYNLALLGEEPEIISTAGNDFQHYKAQLVSMGIETATIHERSDESTASAYIFTDRANNQIAAFHFGAGATAYGAAVATEGRVLAIVAPGNIADMTEFPQYYRSKQFKYVYDPGQAIPALSKEQLIYGITGSEMLMLSDYELGLVLNKTERSEDQLLELTPTLVVTHGAEGSRIRTKEGQTQIKAATARSALDPTGAGDAYRAGFVKGLLANLPLPQCAQLGSCVAVYAVETYGTQTHKFTMEELAARYKETYGDEITLG